MRVGEIEKLRVNEFKLPYFFLMWLLSIKCILELMSRSSNALNRIAQACTPAERKKW